MSLVFFTRQAADLTATLARPTEGLSARGSTGPNSLQHMLFTKPVVICSQRMYSCLACKFSKSLINPAHDAASDAEKALRPPRHFWNKWLTGYSLGGWGNHPIPGIFWEDGSKIMGIFERMVPGFMGIFSFYRERKRGSTRPGGWTTQLGFVIV